MTLTLLHKACYSLARHLAHGHVRIICAQGADYASLPQDFFSWPACLSAHATSKHTPGKYWYASQVCSAWEACQRDVTKPRVPRSRRPRPNPKGVGRRLPEGGRRRTAVARSALSSSRGRRHVSQVHQALSSTSGWRHTRAMRKGHLSSISQLGTACEKPSLTLRQADVYAHEQLSLHSTHRLYMRSNLTNEVRALVVQQGTRATPAGACAVWKR